MPWWPLPPHLLRAYMSNNPQSLHTDMAALHLSPPSTTTTTTHHNTPPPPPLPHPIITHLSSRWNEATSGLCQGCCRSTCSPLRLMLISCTPRTMSGREIPAHRPARPGMEGGEHAGGGVCVCVLALVHTNFGISAWHADIFVCKVMVTLVDSVAAMGALQPYRYKQQSPDATP